MPKDPAFLFYPNDWIGGTMGMTFEEKGAYMELLMMQFNRGHMTSHMIGQTVGQLWVNIKDKFEEDDDGKYFNRRLEEEKTKRANFTKSRRNNIKGKNQYTNLPKTNDGHTDGHMTSHMENVNVNVNSTLNKGEKVKKDKTKIPLVKEVIEHCKTFPNYSPKMNFQIEAKYNAWKENNWKDGNGKEIKNWKTKMQNTWSYFKFDHSQGKQQATTVSFNNKI